MAISPEQKALAKMEEGKEFKLPDDLTNHKMMSLYALMESLMKEAEQFQAAGKARNHINKWNRLLSATLQKLGHLEDQVASMDDLRDTARKLKDQRDEYMKELSALKKTAFPILEFDNYATRIYRSLGQEGPKIESTKDLSKFSDYVVAQCTAGAPEPDMP